MSRVVWRFTAEYFVDRLRPDTVDRHSPVTFIAVRNNPFDGNYVEVLVDDPFELGARYEGEVAPWLPVNS